VEAAIDVNRLHVIRGGNEVLQDVTLAVAAFALAALALGALTLRRRTG